MKKLADTKELNELGYGYSFLPEVCAALREVGEAEAVPMAELWRRRTMKKHKGVYSQRGDDYLIEAQRVCAEDKPKPPVVCPYCGHKMVHQYVYGDHFYRCPKCCAVAPNKDTEAEAYEAAMQRWKEPNAPLTLRELIDYSKNPSNAPIWYEYRGLSEVGSWVNVEVVRDNYCDCSEDEYGKQWRFWPHKPTLGEMEAAPWEEN